ncbi:MAG TPA: hypothetical protein VII72_02005 [Myxococcota bacterium]|jgi:hypothetical protein
MQPEPELWERGGARLGLGWNWTWPFATLRATKSELEVRTPGRRLLVKREQLRSLRIARVLFSKGLEIEHSSSELPAPLIFWTMNAGRLEANLNALGYAVSHEKLSIGI